MKPLSIAASIVAALVAVAGAHAQAPAGSTGACKDGTYTDSASKRGACGGHGGVKEWYGAVSTDKGTTAKTAQVPAAAPAAAVPPGSTGLCKDGTYTDAANKSGACAGHGGVKQWTGPAKSANPTTAPAPAAAPAVTAPPKAAASPAPAATAPAKSAGPATAPPPSPVKAAATGGPGKVWVNTDTKVYHCSGDRWYGKTKKGEYMSEADAKAMGGHASDGKACP